MFKKKKKINAFISDQPLTMRISLTFLKVFWQRAANADKKKKMSMKIAQPYAAITLLVKEIAQPYAAITLLVIINVLV